MMNREELINKIAKLSQFPHKERKQNYESYRLGTEIIEGSRDTLKRMKLMGIEEDLTDKTVLDLGCNLGAICIECKDCNADIIMGVDYEADYIECAKDLAEYNGFSDIVYEVMDLTQTQKCADGFRRVFGEKPVDIVFALSLYKHIKSKMFDLLDSFEWVECIIESNNAPLLLGTGHVMEMIGHITKRKWRWKSIGTDTTRSPRVLLKVEKS
jgi:SAM-dependent methyltransferase